MKRVIMLMTLIFAILFGGSVMVGAQSKAVKKDVKKRTKQFEKDGWKLLASTTTLEYALTKYRTYIEEDEENRMEISGVAEGKNVKIGRASALMDGITSYSTRAAAQVVGKMKGLMSGDNSSISQEEIDKFGAAYQMSVNTKISGLVKQHFVLVREGKDGKKEFNVFMSLDETKAKQAREEAAREAKQKAAMENLSEEVEKFIGEPVEEN